MRSQGLTKRNRENCPHPAARSIYNVWPEQHVNPPFAQSLSTHETLDPVEGHERPGGGGVDSKSTNDMEKTMKAIVDPACSMRHGPCHEPPKKSEDKVMTAMCGACDVGEAFAERWH